MDKGVHDNVMFAYHSFNDDVTITIYRLVPDYVSCPTDSCQILVIPVDSRGIKFGPETSQNDIPVDEYCSGMMSFLISSWNGQKGMHQERNDRNTHY
jgi:hypothetical protein